MEGLQTGMRAWRILAAAARDLLDGGRLRAAAHLGGALGAVGAALADLLCTQAQQRRAPDPPPPAVVTMPHGEAQLWHRSFLARFRSLNTATYELRLSSSACMNIVSS